MEARENNLVWDARRHHNVTMRKGITLAFYLAMIVGGSWAAYDWLVYGGRGIALKLGAFPALFGAYLLWTDFLSPNRNQP